MKGTHRLNVTTINQYRRFILIDFYSSYLQLCLTYAGRQTEYPSFSGDIHLWLFQQHNQLWPGLLHHQQIDVHTVWLGLVNNTCVSL